MLEDALDPEALEIIKYWLSQKAEEQARITLAGNRQQEVLAQVRAATNALEKLLANAQQLRADAEALKSNEDGKRVALHPDLVRQARAFYEALRQAGVEAELVYVPRESHISEMLSVSRAKDPTVSSALRFMKQGPAN